MPWHARLDVLVAPDRQGCCLPVVLQVLVSLYPHLLFQNHRESVDFITGSTAISTVCNS